MAEENYLSSVKFGNTEYDIYAKSALSAGWVPSTAIDGSIPASAITAVNESAISSVNISAVTAVNESAISSVPWSALSALTVASTETTSTAGIWTPKTTVDYVTDVVNKSISNVYKFKGTCTVEELSAKTNNQNGDVWNLDNGGVINSASTVHSATVFKSDNVAWITADGGYWDKLASTDTSAKLDTTAFTSWSANTNGDSMFAGSAASANTAWLAVNVSGSASNVNGQDLINSALSGAAAWETIAAWSADGEPIFTSGNYLVGDGTKTANLALVDPESSIVSGQTQATALVNAQGISSFVDTNYIAKTDIYVNTETGKEHQIIINNL